MVILPLPQVVIEDTREGSLMKTENVLGVLMYLFKHHMHEDCQLDLVPEKLTKQLEQSGYDKLAIAHAFHWLANLEKLNHDITQISQHNSYRIYTEFECETLDLNCRRFLFLLEQQNILDSSSREMVINQALELNAEDFDIHLLKWVILIVLFSQPEGESALAAMEFIVLDETVGGIH